MNNFLTELFINGVAGGMVATGLTAAINGIWLSKVIPWYEERVYHDARFEGDWAAIETFSDSNQKEAGKFSISLKRKGHHVTAKSTCLDGPDKGKIYLMTGSFKNLILTLNWVPEDTKSLERGTIAAKLVENGRKFIGYGAYYSPITEKVHSSGFEATYQGKG